MSITAGRYVIMSKRVFSWNESGIIEECQEDCPAAACSVYKSGYASARHRE